jgi:hypothetical protein
MRRPGADEHFARKDEDKSQRPRDHERLASRERQRWHVVYYDNKLVIDARRFRVIIQACRPQADSAWSS